MRSRHWDVISTLVFVVAEILLVTGTSHNTNPVAIPRLLLSSSSSRGDSRLSSVELRSVVEAARLESGFLLSL